MCGIAGLLTHSPTPYPLDRPIRAMQSALRHRGPDDAGIYQSTDLQAALAHTRLAILDLSEAGHQPMASPDRRYWITFNGEIYNFLELRQQLQAQGERFASQTDTEVILKLYQRHGPDCLHHLRGMFAFALWDDQEKTCFLARDPLGIKPLYYCQVGLNFGFASELRALLKANLTAPDLSSAGLYGYLRTGSVPAPHTLIEGVWCLPPGHWLQWHQGQVTQHRYWQIQFEANPELVAEAPDLLRQALLDSVRCHYLSDVPVGVFLSGGIDSTAIVALSRQVYQGPLNTYSISFADPTWDEGPIAARVAQTFDTHHTDYPMTAAEARRWFPQFLEAVDQPSIDGFNSFCVAQVARDHGQKVVLSGLGGDELFAGYPSFTALPKLMHWGQYGAGLRPLVRAAAPSLARLPSLKLRRLLDFSQQSNCLTSAYYSLRSNFSHQEALALLRHHLPDAPPPALPEPDLGPQPSLADRISALEMNRYMANQLLRDSDVMTMAWGLELRVPLVDRVLLETIAAIPSQARLAPGKQLLIKAVPEIPDWVINRPKRGFRFPFDQWLTADWSSPGGEAMAANCPAWIPLQPWYRRWSLIMLHHWQQSLVNG